MKTLNTNSPGFVPLNLPKYILLIFIFLIAGLPQMGYSLNSTDYTNVPDWAAKPEGYLTGDMVKYKGNVFQASFWASEPGVGDAANNGWRFYDELYDQTAHTPTQQAKIIAYIPTWRKQTGFNYANDEMYKYITHGIIAFLMFSETNPGEFEPASVNDVDAILTDVVNTGHPNGTRISIALGGATDFGFLNLITMIGNDPASPLLDLAVRNIVNFVQVNSLDGVDLDLECWWGKPGEKDQGGRPKSDGPHPAGRGLALFAQRLKQAMPGKLVSATVFGTSWYGNNYDPKMADYVDWLAVMTYDLTGSWNASPVGPQSALFKIRNQESYANEQQGEWPGGGAVNNPVLSVEDTLWYWTNPQYVNWQGAGQNVPRNKIAAGVPLYGYDFAYGKDPDDLSGEVPPGYKVVQYKDILAEYPSASTADNGNIKVPGSTQRPPFISASGEYPFAHNIYLETPDTAVTKLNFLKGIGTQGVIIWELSNDVWEDNTSIIKALYRNSGNPTVRPPISNLAGHLLNLESQPTQPPLGNNTRYIVSNKDTAKFDQLDFSLDPGQKTIFVIHGWNSNPGTFTNRQLDVKLQAAYPNANIIMVDWSAAANSTDYLYVSRQVPYVANALSDVFIKLGIDPNKTIVIGHSLGAHIAGFASEKYEQKTKNKIGEIVGLDPAAPFLNIETSGLNSTQAQRVVAIHSSNSLTGGAFNDGYGNYGSIGTLDIYIKKGFYVYGADISNPNNHGLAIDVYENLVYGQKYPGVNTWAYTPDDNNIVRRLMVGVFPDSYFKDTFDLGWLDNPALKGQYTIDYARPILN
jgi:GH18 family chitinase/pimeloyl-ACP methyl ester carboxylesterase